MKHMQITTYRKYNLCKLNYSNHHDDVIKWKYFPRYWPFVRGIHWSPVIFPHKGQWRGALRFSLICARINSWSKQWWGWWFETPSWSLWRHRNVLKWDRRTCIDHQFSILETLKIVDIYRLKCLSNDLSLQGLWSPNLLWSDRPHRPCTALQWISNRTCILCRSPCKSSQSRCHLNLLWKHSNLDSGSGMASYRLEWNWMFDLKAKCTFGSFD